MVGAAEDAWNGRNPEKLALADTGISVWRNRGEFFSGRAAIVAFLQRKWAREPADRLVKELWTFAANRIAVRFAFEWHDHSGQWFRAYGNENWESDPHGFVQPGMASVNDLVIGEAERNYR